ncbi:bifunctional hydroxymethylpyrimidine kinase/phosphomethylpyrimidine kinase [Marinobacter sp. 1Y8]
MYQRPHVLIVAGLDPSGGAGIQADIQAVTALGCHPLPVVSCLTVQDTCNVYGAEAIDPALITRQLECLATDVPIHAIKTGALGSAAIVEALAQFLAGRPDIPLVVDPVIKAAGGGDLADDALVDAMKDQLFALADVITPNGIELAQLAALEDIEQAAEALISRGCPAVLATGGHGTGADIINQLFRPGQDANRWAITRRGGEYHGSGCTLAASIAAGRAKGLDLEAAIDAAQRFVATAINSPLTVGRGQPVPDRAASILGATLAQ